LLNALVTAATGRRRANSAF